MSAEHTFQKESILIERVPLSILSFFSLMFLVFTMTFDTAFMIISSALLSIIFAIFPLFVLRYLRSFTVIKVIDNTIKVIQKDGAVDYSIPHNLRRVRIDADDLQIELKKNTQRFVLRSHFIKNKSEFHKLFDQIIKEHPPSEDKVILKASVIEIMERLKNN